MVELMAAQARIVLGAIRTYRPRPVVAAAVVAACVTAARAQAEQPPDAASVDRGRYLTEAVLQCFDCHSERDIHWPGWPPKSGRKGAGRVFGPGLTAPNITPDRRTGAGTWTDEQLMRAIRQGVGHDGRALSPAMGSAYYRNLTRADANAVVAYLRTIPPVYNSLPRNGGSSAPPPQDPGTWPAPAASTPVALGKYLVTVAGCESCHTPFDGHGLLPSSGMSPGAAD